MLIIWHKQLLQRATKHLHTYFFKRKKIKVCLSVLSAAETESGYNTHCILFCCAMIGAFAKWTPLINRPENNFRLCGRRKFNKSFINICYLHDFLSCPFHIILVLDEVMVEVIGFDVHRSFLIILSVLFKYLMKNFVD